jgi:hypothetical protein
LRKAIGTSSRGTLFSGLNANVTPIANSAHGAAALDRYSSRRSIGTGGRNSI